MTFSDWSTPDQEILAWIQRRRERPSLSDATRIIRGIASAGRIIVTGQFRVSANKAGLTVVQAVQALLAGTVKTSDYYCHEGWPYFLTGSGVRVELAVTAEDELVLRNIERTRRR